MSGSIVEPHDKMRAKDVNRVARGEQAPRPPQEHGNISKAPPPPSTDPRPKKKDEKEGSDVGPRFTNQLRDCCIRYYEYYRCIQENEKDRRKCEKFLKQYQALCPNELIARWDEERELGHFPGPL